jgi:choline dehydrogenase-like flavoprotein
MIVDARTDAIAADIETDLCIVGGGTAGILLAREFIGQPVQVCLLESGGLTPEPETQDLTRGENVGQPYFPLDTARPRVFGGSGTRWNIPIGGDRLGVRVRPFDPIDFEKRDWVPYSGWPFGRSHLEPFYQRAQAICGVEPASYAVNDWAKERRPLSLPNQDVETIIYKFARVERFVREYPDEVARANNITVCLHSNVLEIETNAAGDCVVRLRASTLEGKKFSVRAKTYVLAAGGIEIPRVLLLSNRTQKNGLGNEHDLVGRFFMEHPHFWAGMLVLAKPEQLVSTALYNEIHSVNGVAVVGKLALTERTLRKEKLLNQNVQLIPRFISPPSARPNSVGLKSARALFAVASDGKKANGWSKHLWNIATDFDSIVVAGAHKIGRTLRGRTRLAAFSFATMMEQVPNPESRVTLSRELDAFGQNRVQLNWKIIPQDIRSAVRTLQIIGGEMEQAGLGQFQPELSGEIPPPNTEGGYHHMGTTRMATNPKMGVVDENCRVHGVGNLFIAGPSVFPTVGYANPVLTIIALTVRLADHLRGFLS